MNLDGFWRDLYRSPFAVPASVAIGDDPPAAVTVIDMTRGVNVPDPADPGVMTLRPVAYVRQSDLAAAGIAADDLDGAGLTFNGGTWTITAHGPRPSPVGGESAGDVQMILIKS